MSTSTSTSTHLSLYSLPSKSALTDTFVGKKLTELRTPALVVDRKVFKDNCERVTGEAKRRGMKFRAHVKTHKTTEGTRLQVQAAGGVKATICSTMIEVWKIIEDGLVDEGLVDDILYSMPIGQDKIPDIDAAQQKIGNKGIVRVMVDHPTQITLLDKYNEQSGRQLAWDVFVKVDGGGRRAGVPPTSEQMKDLIKAIVNSTHVNIFGFYSHFGQSYASDSLSKGSDYFAGEVECVSAAAKVASELGAAPPPSSLSSQGNYEGAGGDGAQVGSWVFSVGATPTAHAAVSESEGELSAQIEGLDGVLELHAGCYCMCDLQQHATTLIPSSSSLALTVLARVVSLYPHRGEPNQGGEAMCDAGALAFSKDTGPYPGFGRVIAPSKIRDAGWEVGRISQEHGTLVKRSLSSINKENGRWVSEVGAEAKGDGGRGGAEGEGDGWVVALKIGQMLRIVPQHACLACANFPWIYVVDSSNNPSSEAGAGDQELDQQVVDVWVPWKGW
ncbi:hypothetical protein IAT40_005890 [Kwoniella sp. CBS 6097]